MTINVEDYSDFLSKIAEDIDISPSKHKDAVDRYTAVGRWLEEGNYPGRDEGETEIYPQGSFRLGTVTRPVRSGEPSDYDIDLVCRIPLSKNRTDPESVKRMVGDRLKRNGRYGSMLDGEGKRCWTLIYSEEDDCGFHLDVLPSVPDPQGSRRTAIAITNKRDSCYEWSASDPKGYAGWFDVKNNVAFGMVREKQKKLIQSRVPDVYARVEDVPDQLVRTPLQRAIQIMKRHRDVRCGDSAYAPISIIITTLSACFYGDEPDLYSALRNIVAKLVAHVALFEGRTLDPNLAAVSPIKLTADGRWHIDNPVNPEENFADRWHEDNHARAKKFFRWLDCLQKDIVDITARDRSAAGRTTTAALGVRPRAINLRRNGPKPWREAE